MHDVDAALTMKEYSHWLPDQNDKLKPLYTKTAKDIEQQFDMPAPMVSCWACMIGFMDDEAIRELFTASNKSIMRALHTYLADAQSIADKDVDELSDHEMSLFAPGPAPLHSELFGP